ncbi:dUTP diphosphatase [Halobacillus litoralis]|uniref:dUTP diphosphatase n=1 Tax=Halobacillus litoralis TaxID=45668 RepID=UPI001CD56202|nr:dUTP diphosphatase [Halobacillus litoralis]MCA1021812.1 dUTP diphosphatase [Halobacillus litoralis]
MNLEKLFEIQGGLDAHIVKEKGLEGQDLLSQKILALQVELGELANEWRGFKFWSNDQKPRTAVALTSFHAARKGETKNSLLEEYVDCLHFILSIGHEFRHKGNALELKSMFQIKDDITSQFNLIFNIVSEDLWNYGEIEEGYGSFIYSFLELGEMLGFTQQQIEEAYLQKNEINHQRQLTGY